MGMKARPPRLAPRPSAPARRDLAPPLAAFQAALPGSRGAAYLHQRGIPLALAQQRGVGYAVPGTWPHAARDWRGARWTGSARYWRRPRAGGSTALSLAAVVAQLAAMEAGELRELGRRLRERLAPTSVEA